MRFLICFTFAGFQCFYLYSCMVVVVCMAEDVLILISVLMYDIKRILGFTIMNITNSKNDLDFFATFIIMKKEKYS